MNWREFLAKAVKHPFGFALLLHLIQGPYRLVSDFSDEYIPALEPVWNAGGYLLFIAAWVMLLKVTGPPKISFGWAVPVWKFFYGIGESFGGPYKALVALATAISPFAFLIWVLFEILGHVTWDLTYRLPSGLQDAILNSIFVAFVVLTSGYLGKVMGSGDTIADRISRARSDYQRQIAEIDKLPIDDDQKETIKGQLLARLEDTLLRLTEGHDETSSRREREDAGTGVHGDEDA